MGKRLVIIHFEDPVSSEVNTLVLRRFRLPNDPVDFVSIETLEGEWRTYEEFEEAKEKEEQDPQYPLLSTYTYIPMWLGEARKIAEALSEVVG